MSVQQALNFIHALREEIQETPVNRINYLASGLTEMVNLGISRGYEFDAEDLRLAHILDWKIRWKKFVG